jgi:hypothetical protein
VLIKKLHRNKIIMINYIPILFIKLFTYTTTNKQNKIMLIKLHWNKIIMINYIPILSIKLFTYMMTNK